MSSASALDALDALVKKGLLSEEQRADVNAAVDDETRCGLLAAAVSSHSPAQLSDLFGVLERECPELTARLHRHRHNIIANGYSYDNAKDTMVMEHNINRQSPRCRRSTACTCTPPPAAPPHQLNNTVEVYVEPVIEDTGDRVGGGGAGWETQQVRLSRVPGYGFGIAVSGGRDNPHFASGDPSIAVSDVLRGGPAEGKLLVNDRIVSANGVPLENVEYARAVQVLRECGSSVTLVVRRRAAPPARTTLRVSLPRAGKKDDLGIVLGCRIYVKEVTSRARDRLAAAGVTLCEGDIVTKINSTPLTDATTLKEARKLLAAGKECVDLEVSREIEDTVPPPPHHNYSALGDTLSPTYSGQNLYVAAPSRPEHPQPPRPPPPRNDDYYSSRRQLNEEDLRHKPPEEPRLISFQKEGSVGLRLSGGNCSGVFVSGVQPGSAAALQGLQPGDKILQVNSMEMSGVTREEAVLFLLSLQDRIDLVVQHAPAEFAAVASGESPGDSFHVKTHFDCSAPRAGELAFRRGDVFRVLDTLHGGTVGAWDVARVGRGDAELERGVIPNKARAEELATAQFNATKKELSGVERGGLFRRRRSAHRRTKSLSREHWDEALLDGIGKLPAYERVVLRPPGPPRPVVLLGACIDLARDALVQRHPDKFAAPPGEGAGVVRLSWVRAAADRGQHALLDVSPAAVDRLNRAHLYPIVVFLKPDSKTTVKRLRQGMPKTAHKSSKKTLELCGAMERTWSHVFTHTLTLSESNVDTWRAKLQEMVARAQTHHLWVSEHKPTEPLSDDFLVSLGGGGESRLSYASSPESELDTQSAPAPARLARAASDPSVAPPAYTPPRHHQPVHQNQQPSTAGYADSKYGFAGTSPYSSGAAGAQPEPRGRGPARPVGGVALPGPGPGRHVLRSAPRPSAHERLFPGPQHDDYHTTGSSNGGGGPTYDYGPPLSHVGVNAPDDLKVAPPIAQKMESGSREPTSLEYPALYGRGVSHARAPSLPAPPQHHPDYAKYSSPPPQPRPLSGGYKPVPPPKPKHYRAGADPPPPPPHPPHHTKSYSHGNGTLDTARPQHGGHTNGYGAPHYGPPQSPPYAGPPPPRLNPHAPQIHPVPPHNPNHIDLAGSREQRGSAFELYRKPQHSHLSSDALSPQTKRKLGKKPSFIKNAVLELFRPRRRRQPAPPPSPQHRHNARVREHLLARSSSSCEPAAPQRVAVRRQASFTAGSLVPPARLPIPRQTSCDNLIAHIDPVYQRRRTDGVIYDPIPKPRRTYASLYNGENPYATARDPSESPYANAQPVESPYGTRRELLSKTENPYATRREMTSKLESPYGARPASKMENPYATRQEMASKLESPYGTRPVSTMENPYASRQEMASRLENPYGTRPMSKLENQYGTRQEMLKLENPYGTRQGLRTKLENPYGTRQEVMSQAGSLYGSRQELASKVENPYGTRAEMLKMESPYATRQEMARKLDSPYAPNNEVCATVENPYGKREERPCKTESPYSTRQEIASKIENSFTTSQELSSKLESPYATRQEMSSKMESPYATRQEMSSKMESPYTTRQEMSSKMENPYATRQECLSNLESPYVTKVELASTSESPHATRQEMPSEMQSLYVARQDMPPKLESPYGTRLEMARKLESPYGSRGEVCRSESGYATKEEMLRQRFSESPGLRTYRPPSDLLPPPRSLSTPLELSARASPLPKCASEPPYVSRREILQQKATVASKAKKESDLQQSVIYESQHESVLSESRTDAEKQSRLECAASDLSLTIDSVPQSTPYASQTLEDDTLTEETKVAAEADLTAPHTTWGEFDSTGGVLSDPRWGVSLHIPPRAIAPGVKQKVYFTVSDPRHSGHAGGPPIDLDNGEAMLSPLVMCGPQGLVFLRPVTLRLPHCANAVPSLGLTLKATDTEAHLTTDWDNIHLPATTTRDTVAVRVDHF